MEDKHTCGLNYEAEYDKAMKELEKAKSEANYLREELRWFYGLKYAVDTIFGEGGYNGWHKKKAD